MSEQSKDAADIEQRYVGEHAETEQLFEGLDPENTDQSAAQQVEAVSDDSEDDVEAMTRKDP